MVLNLAAQPAATSPADLSLSSPTSEQLVTLQTLYDPDIPAAEITVAMERMKAG